MDEQRLKADYERIFIDEKHCQILMQPYRAAVDLVRAKLNALDDEMHCLYGHTPIHRVQSRIKTPQSIIEKLYRRGMEVSMAGVEKLQDIAGLRVICKYVEDVTYISALLLKQEDITLIRYSDYISHPKPTGYRSYHMIIEVPVFCQFGKVMIPVEIQVRTIAMDMWASLEHNLRYKAEHDDRDLYMERLKVAADKLAEIDQEMQDIYTNINLAWQKKESL